MGLSHEQGILPGSGRVLSSDTRSGCTPNDNTPGPGDRVSRSLAGTDLRKRHSPGISRELWSCQLTSRPICPLQSGHLQAIEHSPGLWAPGGRGRLLWMPSEKDRLHWLRCSCPGATLSHCNDNGYDASSDARAASSSCCCYCNHNNNNNNNNYPSEEPVASAAQCFVIQALCLGPGPAPLGP